VEVAPIYLLLDTSGSTARSRFVTAYNRCLPQLVDTLSSRTAPEPRLSVITYGTPAAVVLQLAPPAEIQHIPMLRPGGFGSLVAGFELLLRTMRSDLSQLEADLCTFDQPLAVVVGDDLPPDRAGPLLAARQALGRLGEGRAPRLGVVMPLTVDFLPVSGLRPAAFAAVPGDPVAELGKTLGDFLSGCLDVAPVPSSTRHEGNGSTGRTEA
jgi:hypothetical protein